MINLKRILGIFLFFTCLLGLVYPMVTILVGQYLCPHQAGGSLLAIDSQIVGSSLIAQEFKSDRYFHSRYFQDYPSVINSDLAKKIQARVKEVVKKNGISTQTKIPADMVFSSASGIDPHISIENALLQIPRVAKTRKLSNKIIRNLISEHFDTDLAGIWGVGGVNVLKLNLALDSFGKKIHD
jgi:K+-transporting ATPase ATPase C chain